MFSIEIHTANLQTDDILDRPTTDRSQVETWSADNRRQTRRNA